MTTATMPMLETYPRSINLDRRALATTIDALIACSQACTACAEGREDEAWELLQEAIRMEPRAEGWARGDDELAAIVSRLAPPEERS